MILAREPLLIRSRPQIRRGQRSDPWWYSFSPRSGRLSSVVTRTRCRHENRTNDRSPPPPPLWSPATLPFPRYSVVRPFISSSSSSSSRGPVRHWMATSRHGQRDRSSLPRLARVVRSTYRARGEQLTDTGWRRPFMWKVVMQRQPKK